MNPGEIDLDAIYKKYLKQFDSIMKEADMAQERGGFGGGMINVDKTKLLETLRKNRDGHRGTFLEAMEGFKKTAHDELNRMADDIVKGKSVRLHAELEVPQDHTEEYNAAIQQLEWETADQVSISHSQFNSLVLDKWGWSAQFAATSQRYTG